MNESQAVFMHIKNNGGMVESISLLADQMDLDYSQAHRAIKRLTETGAVKVHTNGPGKPAKVEVITCR